MPENDNLVQVYTVGKGSPYRRKTDENSTSTFTYKGKSYEVSTKKNVDLSKLADPMKEYLSEVLTNDLVRNRGIDLVFTSSNEGEHSEGSLHDENLAIDIRLANTDYPVQDPVFQYFYSGEGKRVREKYGVQLVDPRHGTESHVHLEHDPQQASIDALHKVKSSPQQVRPTRNKTGAITTTRGIPTTEIKLPKVVDSTEKKEKKENKKDPFAILKGKVERRNAVLKQIQEFKNNFIEGDSTDTMDIDRGYQQAISNINRSFNTNPRNYQLPNITSIPNQLINIKKQI